MKDCIFCQIVSKKIPARVFFEDKEVMVFSDIKPKAPVHLLIIPKKHLKNIEAVSSRHNRIFASLILTAKKMAKELGLSGKGYRLIINNGHWAGQVVPHLHLHLLGGKKLAF
ncbi:MAG: histidine triad nucleotide-binding protein [Patescibacteria group bacterium]